MYGKIQEFYTLPDMPGSLYRVALRLFLGWSNLPELPGGFLCIHRRNRMLPAPRPEDTFCWPNRVGNVRPLQQRLGLQYQRK